MNTDSSYDYSCHWRTTGQSTQSYIEAPSIPFPTTTYAPQTTIAPPPSPSYAYSSTLHDAYSALLAGPSRLVSGSASYPQTSSGYSTMLPQHPLNLNSTRVLYVPPKQRSPRMSPSRSVAEDATAASAAITTPRKRSFRKRWHDYLKSLTTRVSS